MEEEGLFKANAVNKEEEEEGLFKANEVNRKVHPRRAPARLIDREARCGQRAKQNRKGGNGFWYALRSLRFEKRGPNPVRDGIRFIKQF